MLYDVYYKRSNAFDRSIPLPKKPPKGVEKAVNIDWDGHTLISKNGKWVESTKGGFPCTTQN